MNISAYEPEMSETVREGLREVLRGLALGDEEEFDKGRVRLQQEVWGVFVWVNNRPLRVVLADIWEIGHVSFFISSFSNRDRFDRSPNQIGACLLTLASKLELTEDEGVMKWIAGLIGQVADGSETVVVDTAGKTDIWNESIAIGPTGELAAWIDDQWWLTSGEPAGDCRAEGWTICQV